MSVRQIKSSQVVVVQVVALTAAPVSTEEVVG
jgi:hypothetical protein